MARIRYPNELYAYFKRLYDTGQLYSYLKENRSLELTISRIWTGRMKKTSLEMYLEKIVPWQKSWEEASHKLLLSNIQVVCNWGNDARYRVYSKVLISDMKSIFHFLGKQQELEKFRDFVQELSVLGQGFVDWMYRSGNFRHWVYALPNEVPDLVKKEEVHTPAQWARLILEGLIERCKNIPEKREYARNIFLPYLDSKFLERNVGNVRRLYNLVSDNPADSKEDLAEKMNISFGEPIFKVMQDGKMEYVTAVQLEERFGKNRFNVVLLSENEKPMFVYQFKGLLVVGGVGWAISHLFEKCMWIYRVGKLYYWGDCDMAGYGILNMVRHYRSDVVSAFMEDMEKVRHKRIGNDKKTLMTPDKMDMLTPAERRGCVWVWENRTRVEQERVEPAAFTAWLDDVLCFQE